MRDNPNLTKRELETLKAVAELERRCPGKWTTYRLSLEVNLDRSGAREFLNRLIGKGLVRKTARARYVLTDAAVAFLSGGGRG